MGGVAPLTYVDLEAWARCTAQHPTPREAQVIMALDDVCLGVIAQALADASPQRGFPK